MKLLLQGLGCALLLALGACGGPTGGEAPVVFAAASLREALGELAELWEREHGAAPVLNLGGSNLLAQQLLSGARADVFLSADEGWMDAVEAAGLVAPGSRVALLANRLVVVVPASADAVHIETVEDLAGPGVRRLALANPQAVPAGRYARAWLEQRGLWEAVRERVAPAVDVRAALAAVEAGAAQAGVVYATDAAATERARVALRVPLAEGPAVVYPLAVVAEEERGAGARDFARFLQGDAAAEVFERHGFVVRARAAEGG